MTARDAERYASILGTLEGGTCRRSLAVDAIKLRFGPSPGGAYVWIDSPWRLENGDGVITTSADYTEEGFAAWNGLLAPLDETVFEGWSLEADGGLVLRFSHGHRLTVPLSAQDPDPESWYDHWYAWAGDREESR